MNWYNLLKTSEIEKESDSLRPLRLRDFHKFLESLGFYFARQSGSHVFYKNNDGRQFSLAIHGNEVPAGVIRRVLNDIGVSKEQFFKTKQLLKI